MITAADGSTVLSPRDFARALGVSESSVKRWIDAGHVPARRTSGGHRRIQLLPALKFLRDSGLGIGHPELLGLSPDSALRLEDFEGLGKYVFELLEAGRGREVARTLMAALISHGTEPAELFDGPVREAMEHIGELWTGANDGIYAEHRATQILLRVLDEIDSLFDPPESGPVAVGGSIEGDPSLLPTQMASTVVASQGMYPVNLGASMPPEVFLEAAEQTGARLVWVSVSYLTDRERQSRGLNELARGLADRNVRGIFGGREIGGLTLCLNEHVCLGRSMADLADLARDLVGENRP